MTSNFLDNACTKIQSMTFKFSKMDQIAVLTAKNTDVIAFAGISGSMEDDFFTKSQSWKKGTPDQKSRCYTCTEAWHGPFKEKKGIVQQEKIFCELDLFATPVTKSHLKLENSASLSFSFSFSLVVCIFMCLTTSHLDFLFLSAGRVFIIK